MEVATDLDADFPDNASPSHSIISIDSDMSTPSPMSPGDIEYLDRRYGDLWRHTATRWPLYSHD